MFLYSNIDTIKNEKNSHKIEKCCFTRAMHLKDEERRSNSVEPYQTVPSVR